MRSLPRSRASNCTRRKADLDKRLAEVRADYRERTEMLSEALERRKAAHTRPEDESYSALREAWYLAPAWGVMR